MIYHHRIPRPPLDACIESFWLYEIEPRPHSLERILPTGAAQLIVNLKEDQTRVYRPECGNRCNRTSGMVLAGVQSRYSVIDTATSTKRISSTTFARLRASRPPAIRGRG